jgi:hypothetical protein
MLPKKKLTLALPDARRRANLKEYATREWMDRITELAMDAYRGPSPEDEAMEPFSVILAPVKVRDMAEEYVSVRYYKMPLKEFRRITAKTGDSLRNKINSLLESMPADTQPPFAQMQEKFCGQGKPTEDTPNSMEDLWDEAYSPALVEARSTPLDQTNGRIERRRRGWACGSRPDHRRDTVRIGFSSLLERLSRKQSFALG